MCDSGARSGDQLRWCGDPGVQGASGAIECLLFVLGRARYRWQVESGFWREEAGFWGRNRPVDVILPGFWATVNKNPEWLIWRETGDWNFLPKLTSGFKIGFPVFQITRFIGTLEILL